MEMKLEEKIAILGGSMREWEDYHHELEPPHPPPRKRWAVRVTLATQMEIEPTDDDMMVVRGKERLVKALGRSMFIRAILAGYDYGVVQEIRDEILRNREEYEKLLGCTTKKEGAPTPVLPADWPK